MKHFGITSEMKVVYMGWQNTNRKGQDIDIARYDVLDADGTLIFRCEIHESMGIYPPHTSYRKFSPQGELFHEPGNHQR